MHKGLYQRLYGRTFAAPDTERGGASGEPPADEGGDDAGDEPEPEPEDDGEPEPEEDGEPEPEPEPDGEPQRQSRGSERIRNQARLNREAAERAEAAERRAAEAERRAAAAEAAAQARQQAQADADEAAAMAAMSDGERTTYLMAKELKGVKTTLGSVQLANADARDSSSFDRFLARNPRYERYVDKVEQIVGQAQRQGQFVSRHLVFKQLLADDVLAGRPGADKQRKDAKQRIDNARGRGTQRRSDAGGAERSRGKGSLTERMERDDPLI